MTVGTPNNIGVPIGTPGYPGWIAGPDGWMQQPGYRPPVGVGGPQAPGAVGLDWNIGTAQLGMQGLATLGNLWSAWQSNQLARDAFGFQKRMGEANLANSIASYNTQLEDRARARAATEGQDPATARAYVERNRLPAR